MVVMYVAAGIHWSVNVYTFIREIRDPTAWAALPPSTIYRWSMITSVALFTGVRIMKAFVLYTTNLHEHSSYSATSL